MSDIFSRFNEALDAMIKEATARIAATNAEMEEKLKDNPDLLLRWRSADFKLQKWVEAHPFECPPPAEFFLK